MNDALGDRMKRNYEDRYRIALPRRTYTILRLDGRAFHQYCRGVERPFDAAFAADMDATAVSLCAEVQGATMGYVQSDEISLLLTDFATTETEPWFGGNVQKIVSVAASYATAVFNSRCPGTFATFDARVFIIPDPTEVENYFIWRQKDATRNSILMAAQSIYSHKELHGVSTDGMQELLFQKGINWNDYPDVFKRGRMICRERPVVLTRVEAGSIPSGAELIGVADEEIRAAWIAKAPPVFTQERQWLREFIPRYA